jgi:putative methionine-R-sulfoxide reductase with GAF domain
MKRPYPTISHEVEESLEVDSTLEDRLQAVVDEGWAHLSPLEVSWIGFYLKVPESEEMILGPRRDKPACSPIGMHGACGQSFNNRAALVVHNVKDLGDGYIACDPRDQSEVVVPFYGSSPDQPIGVLDLDSYKVGSFDEIDVLGLTRVLQSAGLYPK